DVGLLVDALLGCLLRKNLQFHKIARKIATAGAASRILILCRKSLHILEELRRGDLMIADGDHNRVRVGGRSYRLRGLGPSRKLGGQNGAKRQKNEGKFHTSMVSGKRDQQAGSTTADIEPLE